MYTDAEGSGGIGAVLITEDQKLYFKEFIDKRFTDLLESRMTQIIPLEAIAVLVALHRFKRELGQTDTILCIDNTTVLGAIRKGRSSADDVHKIITSISDLCFRLNITAHVFWVPSAMNIADDPSRGKMIEGMTLVQNMKNAIKESISTVK